MILKRMVWMVVFSVDCSFLEYIHRTNACWNTCEYYILEYLFMGKLSPGEKIPLLSFSSHFPWTPVSIARIFSLSYSYSLGKYLSCHIYFFRSFSARIFQKSESLEKCWNRSISRSPLFHQRRSIYLYVKYRTHFFIWRLHKKMELQKRCILFLYNAWNICSVCISIHFVYAFIHRKMGTHQ